MTNPAKGTSNCCRDQLIVVSGDEGTSHWECGACGRACDPYVSMTKSPSVEKRKCKHEWRQVNTRYFSTITMGSGDGVSREEIIKVYCIKCLKIKEICA